MTGKMRKALVDRERLKTTAILEKMSRLQRFRSRDKFYILAVVIWAVLAALPSVYVGRPLPYLVGSTAVTDAYSRVDFAWHDSIAEEAALKNLDSGYARRYREEPLALWSTETHGPLDQVLTAAASAPNAQEVERIAQEHGIALTPAQAEALWHGAVVARNDPYHYLVRPLKEVLENDLFPRGLLDRQRFNIERGRTIQVIRDGVSYPSMVGSERGPTTVGELNKELANRFNARFSVWIPADFKTALAEITLQRIKPNLIYDETASQAELAERRDKLLSRVQTVRENDRLVARGEMINLNLLAKLRAEEQAFRDTQGWRLPVTRFIGNFLLFLALGAAMVIYFRMAEGLRRGVLRRFVSAAALCLLLVFSGYWLIWMGFPGTMLPAGIVAGVVALGMTTRTSIFLTALSSLCGLILFEGRPDLMVGYLTGTWFFAYTAAQVRWRTLLFFTAFLAGCIGSVSFIAWNFARGDMHDILTMHFEWSNILDGSRAILLAALGLVVNWIVCGFIILLLLPLIERFFGVTTRIHLQDLASQEHPLLRRLIVEAPGTYNHSVIVSTLAEAGAEAIGGDGLKARIGGLFHDIGKLVKPEYFTENEFGVSRHDNLSPQMSALLIINHVKDVAEIAKMFKLPSTVLEMITQHHGDSLMRFFYHKATMQAPQGTAISTEPFTYPGPKPQSREAGVLMIADIVEAAVRSLDDPSPQHLKTLVSNLARDKLLEGQLEESGLSMKELAVIEDVYYRLLVSMFHTRVKYPGRTEKKSDARQAAAAGAFQQPIQPAAPAAHPAVGAARFGVSRQAQKAGRARSGRA